MTSALPILLNLAVCFGLAADPKVEQSAPKPTPELSISGGKVRGAIVGADQDVHAFKGIPFAAPPVGELRWKEPQPVQSWEGVRDCFEFGNACPQRVPAAMRAIPQMAINAPYSEDCLYLNVWRPAGSEGKKLPVLFWIHGGGYTMGAASQPLYDGEALARRGAVVVSINYRLGPFGFMAHPALSAESPRNVSGNYGLLDQIAALEWVKDNIAAFGGDPQKVAIFGESAGGGSVLSLLVSPLAKGLFQSAISQSAPEMDLASLNKSTGDRPSAEEIGTEIIEKCGLKEATAASMRSLDADTLVQNSPSLEVDRGFELELRGMPLPMAPIIDGYVIADAPNATFAAGKANPVPLIIGNTRDEMTMFFMRTPTPKEVAEYEKEVREDFGEKAAAILAAYPASDAKSIRDALIHLVGDIMFGSQARYTARMHAAAGNPTYEYIFSRGTKQLPMALMGAHHGVELAFLFGMPANPDEADRRVVDAMQGYWINLAATGNPNGAGLPEWPAVTSENDVLIEIDDTIEVRKAHRAQQLDLIDQHYRRARPTAN